MDFLHLRDKKLNNLIYIFQTGFILLSLIIILKKLNVPGTIYPSLWSSFNIVIGIFILIGCFLLLKYKGSVLFIKHNIDIIIVSINTFIVLLLLFYASYYETRILFMFPIIFMAIRQSKKASLLYVTVSSVVIIGFDLLYSFPQNLHNLEFDFVLISIFCLIAWLISNLIETEKNIRNELIEMADRDSLTGLYNHRAFFERLDRAIKSYDKVSLILMDIDYFKMFNDTWGHQLGDVVLLKICEIIKEKNDKEGIAARYGGEEFAIILPNKEINEARIIAENIRATIEKYQFYGAQTLPQKKLTVSIGVGTYPLMAKTKEDLVSITDEALYKAKFVSKNKVEVYYSVFDELGEVLKQSEQKFINSVKTLIMVINAKDKYTYGHCERVMELATSFANYLNLSDVVTTNLRFGALLHDIGKIEISREILNKHGKLSDSEWEILKTHPIWGADIIRPIGTLEPVIDIIEQHHENLDGTGYPKGLTNSEICYEAKILRIIDSYDAMVSNRPYRAGMSHEQAIGELMKNKGTHYDSILVNEFAAMLEK